MNLKKRHQYFYFVVTRFLAIMLLVVICLYFIKANLISTKQKKVLGFSQGIIKLDEIDLVNINEKLDIELISNNKFLDNILEETVIDKLHQAQESVHLAVYSLSSSKIAETLFQLHKTGINIHSVLDVVISKNFPRKLTDISWENILSTNQDHYYGMHHKFAILDFGLPSSSLILGSFNWSTIQSVFDPNQILIIKNRAIIDTFKQEFDRLFAGYFSTMKFNTKSFKPLAARYLFRDNEYVEIWFSPGIGAFNVNNRIIDLIRNAKKEVYLSSREINSEQIVDALISKPDIKKYIISDNGLVFGKKSKIYKLLSSQVPNLHYIDDTWRDLMFLGQEEYIKNTYNINMVVPYFHKNTLIVDGLWTYIGSNNLTFSGAFANDESGVFIRSSKLANKAKSLFRDDYNLMHGSSEVVYELKDGDLKILSDGLINNVKSILFFNKESYLNQIDESRKSSYIKPCFISQYSESLSIPKSCLVGDIYFIKFLDRNGDLLFSDYQIR